MVTILLKLFNLPVHILASKDTQRMVCAEINPKVLIEIIKLLRPCGKTYKDMITFSKKILYIHLYVDIFS